MSKVFVVPDVHLRPWMFEKASEKISENPYDVIVMLGDLVDDWGQERNASLYRETFDAAIEFVKLHPNTLYCYGNHEMSYIWGKWESGYSGYVENIVREKFTQLMDAMPPENHAYIHRIDDVLFSHAGLTEKFVYDYFGRNDVPDIDYIVRRVNKMGMLELWDNDSPIWARPQNGRMKLYPANMMQVVGHTPITKPTKEGNLLTVDVFSTYRDGKPIGNAKFVCVDTKKRRYEEV